MLLLPGLAFIFLPATRALACGDPSVGMYVGMQDVKGDLGCQGKNPGDGKTDRTKWSKGGQPPLCVWVPQPGYVPLPGEPTAGPNGQWYAKFCKFGKFKTLAEFEAEMASWDEFSSIARGNIMRRAGIEYRFFKTPPPARPTAEQVMYWVAANLPFPETHVAVSPKPTRNVVNFPTWVWLTDAKGKYDPAAYAVKSKDIQLFGYALRWQIVPQVAISPGDGSTPPSCAGTGIPWSPGADEGAACTATYAKSGKYNLTATVGWTVQWWLNGAPQGDLGGPDNTATIPITVGEIHTLVQR